MGITIGVTHPVCHLSEDLSGGLFWSVRWEIIKVSLNDLQGNLGRLDAHAAREN
jgi:hypothetical protein